MTCDQSELHMAELLAGEIAAGDRAALERHLLDCAACRADFDLARGGYTLEWADVPVPAAAIESTLASLKEAPGAVRFFRWATAAAALFGMAVLLLTSSRRPAPAMPAEPPVTAAAAERSPVLASMQEPIVGALSCRDFDGRPVGDLSLKSHEVSVEILDGIAKTTVEENFENHTDRRLEGTFTFPLPADASISRLALEVNGKIEEGTCLERERAREVFESIVRKMQDPALLEWQPGGLFKCRIFPIEPRSTKRVIVAYTQTLPSFQGKMRYVYPLASEKTRSHPPGELRIDVLARFSGALTKIESTSHHLDVRRKDAHEASMSFRAANYRPSNDFVVTLEPQEEELRVVCHKPEGEDGYVACFATPRAEQPRAPQKYTFVLDASASISAPRLEVAKRLVRAMMERRIDGDRFEVIAHSIATRSSGEVDLRAANTFMDALQPVGGSDVLRALQAAGPGQVIYIGKGQPTFGETGTAAILAALEGRSIRTIAVGADANLPLLERLGGMMRITPNDDVDKRVGEIAATLGSPMVSGLKVEGDNVVDVGGARDVFAGERLVAVGRYKAAGPSKVVVSGRGYRREVEVDFPAKEERHNAIRRLWAQRKAADLALGGEATRAELTALGVKYQIMTPYTSFLVLESEQMWKDHRLQREVQKQDELLGKQREEEKLRKEKARQELAVKRIVPTDGRDDFRVRIEQGQLEVTKHVRDAERYLNARMFDQARREFEHAEFKIRNMPFDMPSMKELLPGVRDGIVKSRNAQILENARVEDAKRRSWEAEASPQQREWNELLDKLKSTYAVTEQEKQAAADRHYREAERCYTAGDFLKAEQETQKALQLSPTHAPARALQTENQFVLGKGKATPSTQEYDTYMREALVRHQQVLVEVDQAHERGKRHFNLGEYDQAEREFRKILEFSKWMPTGAELEARRKSAAELLERTRSAWWQAQSEEEGKDRHRLVEENRDRNDPVTAVVPLRTLPSPAGQTPRLEPGRILNGRPEGSTDPEVHKRWDLYRRVEGQLTKDSAGNQVGGLEFDPHSNVFIVRDTPEAQARVRRVIQDAESAQSDLQAFVRQSELQLAQMQELTKQIEEHRTKLARTENEKSPAAAEVGSLRQQIERLESQLGFLEEQHVERVRGRRNLEEKVNAIALAGANVNVAPKKSLQAKVTAVATETGLVVLSIGKDDGVLEGDEFSIFRGGDFVAKLVIDRLDRKWAAGKIVHQAQAPRVGDDASNLIVPTPPADLPEAERLDRESLRGIREMRAKLEAGR